MERRALTEEEERGPCERTSPKTRRRTAIEDEDDDEYERDSGRVTRMPQCTCIFWSSS